MQAQQVTIPVTIQNNPGIASFRFRIAYDTTALTFVSATKGPAITGGTLRAEYQPSQQELAITWFDVKNITSNGVLFQLVFEVADTAGGHYPLSVSYLPEDIANATWQQVDVTVDSGLIQVGYNISGKIASFGQAEDPITVKLMQGDTQIASTTTTDGTYTFLGVPAGDYQLMISKANHNTHVFDITLSGANIIFDASISIIGDFTNDGIVNNEDVIYLLWHTMFPESYPL